MVLDISSPQIKEHVNTIVDVLKEMGANEIPIIQVLNKVDLISDGTMIEKLQRSFPGSITISAQNHLRLSDIKRRVIKMMDSNYKTVDLEFSYDDGKIISQVQQGVEVLEREYEEKSVRLKIRGSQSRISQIMASIS
jgi:GTP-binding protein HflX